jgi:hypothetical protein
MARYEVTVFIKTSRVFPGTNTPYYEEEKLGECFDYFSDVKTYLKGIKKYVAEDDGKSLESVSVHKEISKNEYRKLGIVFDE